MNNFRRTPEMSHFEPETRHFESPNSTSSCCSSEEEGINFVEASFDGFPSPGDVGSGFHHQVAGASQLHFRCCSARAQSSWRRGESAQSPAEVRFLTTEPRAGRYRFSSLCCFCDFWALQLQLFFFQKWSSIVWAVSFDENWVTNFLWTWHHYS